MSKVKLNLVSGNVQERELVTAFNYNNVKYVIFDGESTGSMGLPIILVGKDNFGKIVGISDAEEWKSVKECLKKIIAGEDVEYSSISNEIKADDIYYRQLTLPIASFDKLKTSYKAPQVEESAPASFDSTPIFEAISPEEVSANAAITPEPIAPSNFTTVDAPTNISPDVPAFDNSNINIQNSAIQNDEINKNVVDYDQLKSEFLESASKLFDDIFKKFNHND